MTENSLNDLLARALSAHKDGRSDSAGELYRQVLAADPNHPIALVSFGLLRHQAGDSDGAIELMRRSIAVDPTRPEAHAHLGNALLAKGDADQAAQAYRSALALDGDAAQPHYGLGEALRALKQPQAAIQSYEAAIRCRPDFAPAYNGLGAAWLDLDDQDAALGALSEAVRLDPLHAEAYCNMAAAFFRLAMDEQAIICARRATELAPAFVDAHFHLALALMRSGDLAEGLAEYEWRRRRPDYPRADFPIPEWQGEDLGGKSLLVYGEQGFGDVIHFARFAAPLARAGAKVVLAAPAPLVALLRTVPGVAEVVEFGTEIKRTDFHLPLLSIPHRIGLRLDTIPAPERYVAAAPEAVATWVARLAQCAGLKVGLAWAGSPTNPDDRRRSVGLGALAGLAKVPGISIVSLQKDAGDAATRQLAEWGILDLTAEMRDFADTAALIENLDLVITVDTAVAHLAGALGKPTWILSRFDNDWRWFHHRSDSPWYPQVRLIRQSVRGEWGGVVDQVVAALRTLAPGTGLDADAAALLAEANRCHQAGQLDRAGELCRRILAQDSGNAEALHLLGIVASQIGRHDMAADLIAHAIEADGGVAHYHINLGNSLKELGQHEEAEASYLRAIQLKPDDAITYSNLGNLQLVMGKYKDAEASCRKAIALDPKLAAAYNNLGSVLTSQVLDDEAERMFLRAAELKPDYIGALSNLGLLRQRLHRYQGARECFERIVALAPNSARSWCNLALALKGLGLDREALDTGHRALNMVPLSSPEWMEFVEQLNDVGAVERSDLTIKQFANSFAQQKSHTASSLVLAQDVLRSTAVMAKLAQANRGLFLDGFPELLATEKALISQLSHPFITGFLAKESLASPVLEGVLAALRRHLLALWDDGELGARLWDGALDFMAALACQCFRNEYVYFVTEAEKDAVARLEARLAEALSSGRPPEAEGLCLLAAYRPLHTLPFGRDLADRQELRSSAAVDELLRVQVDEPLIEAEIRAHIPVLTPISDEVSIAVRSQYEDNPYPRWVVPGMGRRYSAHGYLELILPFNTGRIPPVSDRSTILIAGCGSGKEPTETSLALPLASITAVDLSLSSIAYGVRRCSELGLSAVKFGQGDLLNIGSLGRQFDMVASSGVIHHMADPEAGLRALLGVLKPGGLLKLGLYSEIARRAVVEARRLIADKGYPPTPDGIRQLRYDVDQLPGDHPLVEIKQFRDYYGMSMCRDLLFHVQEHRFTLPQIKDMLHRHGLEFLGFTFRDIQVAESYRRRFPGDPTLTDLDNWAIYEDENPTTFRGMYQFWMRAPS